MQKSVFVPLMKYKGETKMEISCGSEGIGANSAYAFSNHFSAMANGFLVYDNSTEYKNRYNYQAEIGLGFFNSFQDSFIYETFIGASRGWLNSCYERSSDEFVRYNELGIFSPLSSSFMLSSILANHSYSVNGYGNYYTTFIQQSFGWGRTPTNWNSFSWTFRSEYIKFDQYVEAIKTINQSVFYNVFVPEKVFIQFLLVDKIGITNDLLFTGQLGINFDITETAEVFAWNKLFCYLGAEYTFHMKERKGSHKAHPKRRYKNIFERGY